MKILVCIKQVPDPDSRFRANPDGTWLDETGLDWRMNEYDEYAVEQALQLKEKLGGTPEVVALSVGPGRVLEVIQKAMAMGCDSGVHILDGDVSIKEPWQIAGTIAGHISDKGFDLIFTGMQSQDRGSAQVGVMIAELLHINCVTAIVGFAYENGTITVKRELEGGLLGVVRLPPPALLTCQSGLNAPRYPTLPNILKARRKEIRTVPVEDLPAMKPLTTASAFRRPPAKGSAIIIDGDLNGMADRVAAMLREKTGAISGRRV